MKGENTMNSKIKDFLRKYTMVIALVIVFILFCALTDGRLLFAQNMSNLMLQNGYVLVLAFGMLLCILTGGNIDLSVGSVIQYQTSKSTENEHAGKCCDKWRNSLITNPVALPYTNTCRHVHFPWIWTSGTG